MGNKASRPATPSPLLQPCLDGDLDKVRTLVEAALIPSHSDQHDKITAFLNQQDPAGNAAIHGAVFAGHLSIVEYLAEKGASLKIANGLGCTPLWLAAGYNRRDIFQFLVHHPTLDAKQALLQTNNTGDSPLLAAASKGHLDMCETILMDVARLNMDNNNDNNNNHHHHHPISAEMLQCQSNKSGDTPLLVAVASRSADDDGDSSRLVDLLCHESIINHCNQKGFTALHVACERDSLALVIRLVEKGADVHMTDANGDSILAVAAFCGSEEVLDYLVRQQDAVVTTDNTFLWVNRSNDKTGCTPLWLATRAGHLKCAQRLLQAGADPCLANRDGLTPKGAAEKFQRPELVTLFKKHEESHS